MTDFAQTMRDWQRMCSYYEKVNNQDPCEPCLLFGQCGAIFEMDTNIDWEKYADVIEGWAAENPEPVYPTWIAWLMSEGVIPTNYMAANSTDSGVRAGTFYVTSKAFAPIPADIAQKLELEPKV